MTSLRTGEIQRFETWVNAIRRLPNNRKFIPDTAGLSFRIDENLLKNFVFSHWQKAAYFVGFRDERPSKLELMAESAGW